MNEAFSQILSHLRREKGISQREASQELGVSQALLSHYEKGIREPGLSFVVRACDFYQVSADYLLGRTPDRKSPVGAAVRSRPDPEDLRHTADILSEAFAEACRREPKLRPLFQRMAEQTGSRLGKE